MLCKQFDLPFACFVQFPEEHDPFFFHLKKIREKMTHITRQIEITPDRCKRENELSIHYLCWIIRKYFFTCQRKRVAVTWKVSKMEFFHNIIQGLNLFKKFGKKKGKRSMTCTLRDKRWGRVDSWFLCFRSFYFTINYAFDIADLKGMQDWR